MKLSPEEALEVMEDDAPDGSFWAQMEELTGMKPGEIARRLDRNERRGYDEDTGWTLRQYEEAATKGYTLVKIEWKDALGESGTRVAATATDEQMKALRDAVNIITFQKKPE